TPLPCTPSSPSLPRVAVDAPERWRGRPGLRDARVALLAPPGQYRLLRPRLDQTMQKLVLRPQPVVRRLQLRDPLLERGEPGGIDGPGHVLPTLLYQGPEQRDDLPRDHPDHRPAHHAEHDQGGDEDGNEAFVHDRVSGCL